VRVVFLTHNYPRHAGDIAGAFLHPLAMALRAQGEDLRVVAPADRGRGGATELDGVPVSLVRYASADRERYAYSGTMQSAMRSPAGLLALARLHRALRRGARVAAAGDRGTVMHAHWWVPAGRAAPPEYPLVVTLHGTDAMLLTRSWLARRLARRVFERARIITTVSTALARIVAEASGRPLGAIRVQPMPVDAAGWGWSAGGGGVAVVSRLVAQKRIHLAIEAIGELRHHGLSPQVSVVGDGPERPALEALVRQRGLESQIRFRGALPFADVLEVLERADLAIVPARGEGFGLAAAEALMAGVPVVACADGGGLLDVVPTEGGGRIAAAEPGAIAAGAAALLKDPAAPAAARDSGAVWRRQLAPGMVAEQFRLWYREAARA
jgi:glycosyltransferase involved in cell wall biosynthesis